MQRYGCAVTDDKRASKCTIARSLFVAVGGSRPGIYAHDEAVARFYAAKKNGTVTPVGSFAEGRRLLNKPPPPYFRESEVPSSNVIDLSYGVQPSHDEGKYFVVLGGARPGVYMFEIEAFDVMTEHGACSRHT